MDAAVDDQPMPHIAVLGAGPIGLEAALYGRFLGYGVTIYEQGEVGQNLVRHGRLPLSFAHYHTPLGLAALEAQDPHYRPPADDERLTGRAYLDRYLLPLAHSDLIEENLQLQTAVRGVAREGLGKAEWPSDPERADRPFVLLVQKASGAERIDRADIVIDATGVEPLGMGVGGLPAAGERAIRGELDDVPPAATPENVSAFNGRHTLVVGSTPGAAATAVLLAQWRTVHPHLRITWITAGDSLVERIATGYPAEGLDEAIAEAERYTAGLGLVEHWPGTWVEQIEKGEDGRWAVRTGGKHSGRYAFDRIVIQTGVRPDLSIHRELQVQLCDLTEAPRGLGELLRTRPEALRDLAPAAGAELLSHREPGFYIVGSKSFGRVPNFVPPAGYRQIRDIFTQIGEREGLDLYRTVRPGSAR